MRITVTLSPFEASQFMAAKTAKLWMHVPAAVVAKALLMEGVKQHAVDMGAPGAQAPLPLKAAVSRHLRPTVKSKVKK